LEDFAIAIEIEKENGIYYHNRACCLRNMGLLEKAVDDFKVALKLDNDNPIIYSNMG